MIVFLSLLLVNVLYLSYSCADEHRQNGVFMKFLIINGPNLNLLGLREPGIYGVQTYGDLTVFLQETAEELCVTIEIVQSNHEGALVDFIQDARTGFDAIIINPAAYTHTSIAILDALKAVALPAVEVHLSVITQREAFRHVSYPSMACLKSVCGKGFAGYKEDMLFLKDYLYPNP